MAKKRDRVAAVFAVKSAKLSCDIELLARRGVSWLNRDDSRQAYVLKQLWRIAADLAVCSKLLNASVDGGDDSQQ